MCAKQLRADEISMDEIEMMPGTVTSQIDSDVDKALADVFSKYMNLSANDIHTIMTNEDSTTRTLIADDHCLPLLGATSNLKPEDIKVTFKWFLGNAMQWYVYEYDGQDIARAYFTDQNGMIIGNTTLSVSGLKELKLNIGEESHISMVQRDLAWNVDTTVADIQQMGLFANEEYRQHSVEVANEICAQIENKIALQENQDEEIF